MTVRGAPSAPARCSGTVSGSASLSGRPSARPASSSSFAGDARRAGRARPRRPGSCGSCASSQALVGELAPIASTRKSPRCSAGIRSLARPVVPVPVSTSSSSALVASDGDDERPVPRRLLPAAQSAARAAATGARPWLEQRFGFAFAPAPGGRPKLPPGLRTGRPVRCQRPLSPGAASTPSPVRCHLAGERPWPASFTLRLFWGGAGRAPGRRRAATDPGCGVADERPGCVCRALAPGAPRLLGARRLRFFGRGADHRQLRADTRHRSAASASSGPPTRGGARAGVGAGQREDRSGATPVRAPRERPSRTRRRLPSPPGVHGSAIQQPARQKALFGRRQPVVTVMSLAPSAVALGTISSGASTSSAGSLGRPALGFRRARRGAPRPSWVRVRGRDGRAGTLRAARARALTARWKLVGVWGRRSHGYAAGTAEACTFGFARRLGFFAL